MVLLSPISIVLRNSKTGWFRTPRGKVLNFLPLGVFRWRRLVISLKPSEHIQNIKGILTGIATPSRVYLIDTGNEGRARDSRTP